MWVLLLILFAVVCIAVGWSLRGMWEETDGE